MEHKMKKILAGLLISTTLLAGCASNTITEDKFSGFLSDYSILKKGVKDKDTLFYITPNVNWSQYNSVMVDKVLVITPDGDEKTDGKLLVAISDKFQSLIKQELAKEFKVVEHAGVGTIRLQAAITSVYASYDDLKGYQYIPIAAAVTGAARASGVEDKSVRVMAEAKMLDSTDGKLLIQAVDLKAGGKEESETSGILLAEVEPILKQWAVRMTDRLTSLRDKYRKNHK
jgi:hypothetical protein